MAKLLDMPKLSPTMEEGRLAVWHKKEGDVVDVDELLAEVETDKATMEFRSFDKGTILKLLVAPGSMVVLGQPVAILGTPGEDFSSLLARTTSGVDMPAPAPPSATTQSDFAKLPAQAPTPPTQSPTDGPSDSPADSGGVAAMIGMSGARVKASPLVRKRARQAGVDLRRIAGSGPHGRIIERDLEKTRPTAAKAPAAASTAASANNLIAPESRPLSMMRKTIARRLTESKQTVPHFYLTVDLDVDALVALREEINADFIDTAAASNARELKPHRVSMNDLMVRACALALQRVPECNAQFTPEAILYHQRVDISIAVAVEDGLVTPVVRNADQKSVREISADIRDLASRARSKRLRPEEMTAGTFSISNLGMFGIDSFAAVINPPEGAILAVGQVRREPVVRNDAVTIGHQVACTLSCDHRVVDGAVGASFLKELRALLARPLQLLL